MTNLGRGPLDEVRFQRSTFRQDFLPKDFNLNNISRGQLDEATYQISKAWTFYLHTRTFLKFLPIRIFVKHVTPGGGGILDPRAMICREPIYEATYQISKAKVFFF